MTRFWQLHTAKHQSRNCTCTSPHKTQLQLTASSSYSLAHRRSSIRHCQSTSSRPATELHNTRHQPCITIVTALNLTQPTHRSTLNYIIQQPASASTAIILTWTTSILASSKRNSVTNTAEHTHSRLLYLPSSIINYVTITTISSSSSNNTNHQSNHPVSFTATLH